MTQSDLPPDPVAVADAFGLIGDVGELNSVDGAWSNRVYRFAIGELEYAVKEMRNPWDISSWREWLEQAWHFKHTAIAAGVAAPTPVPNPADGSCLAEVARVGGRSLAALDGPRGTWLHRGAAQRNLTDALLSAARPDASDMTR